MNHHEHVETFWKHDMNKFETQTTWHDIRHDMTWHDMIWLKKHETIHAWPWHDMWSNMIWNLGPDNEVLTTPKAQTLLGFNFSTSCFSPEKQQNQANQHITQTVVHTIEWLSCAISQKRWMVGFFCMGFFGQCADCFHPIFIHPCGLGWGVPTSANVQNMRHHV